MLESSNEDFREDEPEGDPDAQIKLSHHRNVFQDVSAELLEYGVGPVGEELTDEGLKSNDHLREQFSYLGYEEQLALLGRLVTPLTGPQLNELYATCNNPHVLRNIGSEAHPALSYEELGKRQDAYKPREGLSIDEDATQSVYELLQVAYPMAEQSVAVM